MDTTIFHLPYLSTPKNVLSLVRSLNIPPLSLLRVQQSAYRPFHSTDTALLSVHNDLVRSIDNGKVSLLVLLDLSAAFDNVDHQFLSSVLANRFSVDSTALSWFESYLTDGTKTFTYKGEQTSSFPVDCSVPQGSVLGPRCFLSYIPRISLIC